jgi:hypothetical protein
VLRAHQSYLARRQQLGWNSYSSDVICIYIF